MARRKKGLLRGAALVLALFLLVLGGRYARLVANGPFHALVLYHIPTGTMVPLAVYDTVGGQPWLLAPEQTSGTVELLPAPWEEADLWRVTSEKYVGAYLPSPGFLLLDLYQPGRIKVYPMRTSAFVLREYVVRIEEDRGRFFSLPKMIHDFFTQWLSSFVYQKRSDTLACARRYASSQAPYPSFPPYGGISLIPPLVLFPPQTLRWFAAGALSASVYQKRSDTQLGIASFLVREAGLEPARP